MQALLRWSKRHQSALARAVLMLGAMLVAATLVGAVPRETAVEYALGEGHARVVELVVAYERDGEVVHGTRMAFPGGAPGTVRHVVSASQGALDVHVELRQRDGGSRIVRRRIEVPAEGTIRLVVGGARR